MQYKKSKSINFKFIDLLFYYTNISTEENGSILRLKTLTLYNMYLLFKKM